MAKAAKKRAKCIRRKCRKIIQDYGPAKKSCRCIARAGVKKWCVKRGKRTIKCYVKPVHVVKKAA